MSRIVPDLSRRALLAAGAGLCTARPALSNLLQAAPANPGYVAPDAFGAVPDDPRAAESNTRAFNAMADRAFATGVEMIIPQGVWYVKADGSNGTGWRLRPPPGRPCVIRGQGAASVIRRAPTASASKFAALIRLWVTAGGEAFDLQGFTIDGNESAFPFDHGDPWAYQQSHCAELASMDPGKAAASFIVRDVALVGVVADGFKIGAQCDRFEAQRVTAAGRTRRHRSDIQFSRLPRLALVTDCTVDAFESEPSKMVAGATMRISNLVARSTLDLAGPEDDPAGRLKIEAVNCKCGTMRSPGVEVNTTSIFRCDGTFTDCSFATAPAKGSHNNTLRGSNLRFDRCDFAIGPAFGGGPGSSPLYALLEQSADKVEIANSLLHAQPGVEEGAFMLAGAMTPGGTLELRNCENRPALDYVVEAAWRATVHLSGGTLRARKAVVATRPRAKASKVSFDDKAGWQSPALLVEKAR